MRLPPAHTLPCALCGQRGTNRHERLPRGRGGLRDDFNTVILCGSGTTGCHGFITANPEWAREHGWTITGQMVRGTYIGSHPDYLRHYGDGRRAA